MTHTDLKTLDSASRIVGWSALLAAVAAALTFVTSILFFSVGGIWGPISDLSGILFSVALLPVIAHFYRRHRDPGHRTLTILAFIAMVPAPLAATLVTSLTWDDVALYSYIGGIIFGVWLLVEGVQGRRGSSLSPALSRLTAVTGLVFVLSMLGFWLLGYNNPLTQLAGLLLGILQPVWTFAMARLLLRDSMPVPDADQTVAAV